MNETVELLCKDCDRLLPFTAPVCEDGQDDGELMCVVCGTAVSVACGLLLVARSSQVA